jgi:ATP-dependent helicase/nuclease subunit A
MSEAFARAVAQQRSAADPQANVFVTANAGSGKTKVLIDRIARLLLEGSPPAAFLCITFTKAAAAEMQRRLFDRLGGWSVADDATLARQLSELLGAPAPARILNTARGLFARALETPGGLRIQTIHAFCERLLRRFPLEAGIAAGFGVADESMSTAMLETAWQRAVQAAPVRASLERFARRLDDEPLDKFLARLPRARSGFGVAPGFDLAAALNARGLDGPESAQVARLLDQAPWDDLTAAAERLARSKNSNDQKLAERIRVAKAASGAAKLEAYYDVFLTTTERTPAKNAPTKAMRDADAFIDRLFSSAGETGRVVQMRAAILAAGRAEDSAAAAILAQALIHEFDRLKRARGVLDFDDLIAQAHALLAERADAAWVLYKLDGGIDHILIDEGQDTSPLQWALLAPLQQEFFAGEAARAALRTVFAVGDPKQSIYGFQGADPHGFLGQSQILSARAAGADRAFVAPLLAMSFRSTPEVLAAVDAVFADISPEGVAPGEFDKVAHTAHRGREIGRVEFWPLATRPDKSDAQPWLAPVDYESGSSAAAELARLLAQRVRGWIAARDAVWDKGVPRAMHAGDVLVLVRQRGALFKQLSLAFKREGLDVAGADRLILRDDPAVQDLMALMQVALDPADDYALACVLKGPFVGLIDDAADLAPLAYGRARGESLAARLLSAAAEKYAPAKALLARLSALRGVDPFTFLSDFLERCDEHGRSGWGQLFERLGTEVRDPVEELLSRALGASREGAATLQHFLAAIEADGREIKREMDAPGQAVRIMTVHGSKGLEAPVVILPDTAASPDPRKAESLFFTDHGPIVSFSRKDDDALAGAARAEVLARGRAEQRRLLYVAMTRARDRLIVCGAQSSNGEGRAAESWHALVEPAMARIGEPFETPTGPGFALGAVLTAPAAAHAEPVAVAAPHWATAPAPVERAATITNATALTAFRPAGLSINADGANRFRRGRLIHALLQRLPELAAAARREAALQWLLRQNIEAAIAAGLVNEAMAVIDHPDFAAAFGPMSRAEAPIIGRALGFDGIVRGVVDRLAVTPQAVLVVDFKTDRPAPAAIEDVGEAYLVQLAAYRAVLAAAFPGRPVQAALIWTEAPRLMPVAGALLDRFARL